MARNESDTREPALNVERKPYEAPTLRKAALLSAITALAQVSVPQKAPP